MNPEKLTKDAAQELLQRLSPGWSIQDEKLFRIFIFPDFRDSMKFANRVSEIAEDLNHHPDMRISYGKVEIQLSTHDVSGLSEKDFELAKRITG